ncbi:MAG: hypothetical protein HQK83_18975 [Fibrobacteria bacterium]|nr:hypothetical protein [Fibrobacteria bacterium]
MSSSFRLQRALILLSMLMSGFCGIIAELCLFNLANGLIGGMNIVLTYTMGVMMFCMGLGALTVRLKPLGKSLQLYFIGIETVLSLLVGSSVLTIYLLGAYTPQLSLMWILIFSALIGYLIGFEIPLILLINEKLKRPLQDNSALVLFADYFGSLLAFILFSHVLLVKFGLFYTSLTGASLNLLIAAVTIYTFKDGFRRPVFIALAVLAAGLVLGGLFLKGGGFMHHTEQLHYRDKIKLSRQTPYQKLVLTDNSQIGNPNYNKTHLQKVRKEVTLSQTDSLNHVIKRFKPFQKQKDIRLYINGGLQFSTVDEFYYHEMLVHPVMYLCPGAKRVLIGGGGDGMALREVLKYSKVTDVLVVDIDQEMTRLFTGHPLLSQLNDSSFHDQRVRILNTDMFSFLKTTQEKFDIIILDFPDPHHDAVGKLYSKEMYTYAKLSLEKGGFLITQSTSPYFNCRAFLIIAQTLDAVFTGNTLSLKVAMPTFGLWGFQLASEELSQEKLKSALEQFETSIPTDFVNRDIVQSAYRWSKITFREIKNAPVNSWLQPVLVNAYLEKGL